MGSAPSNSGGGGTLSGGKTMLAGTFLAEQTHSNPPSYTLVSVHAIIPRVQAGSSGGSSGSRSKMNRSRVEKSGPHCTKLSALDEIDSLLLKDEEAPRPAKNACAISAKFAVSELPGIGGTRRKSKSKEEHLRSDALASGTSGQQSQCGKPGEFTDRLFVEDAGDEALPHLSMPKPGRMLKTPLQSRGCALLAPAQLNDDLYSCAVSSVGELEAASTRLESRPSSQKKRRLPGRSPTIAATSNDKSEVFDRLYIARKPWVAGETNSQLLQYLATRGCTPEIISPKTSISRSGELSVSPLSPQASTRSCRSKYRSHRELFDDCLHRDPSPERTSSKSPRPSARGGRPLYSPKQLATAQASRELSGRIVEKIKEIVPIPLDPARAFMEAEFNPSSPPYSPAEPASHRPWGK